MPIHEYRDANGVLHDRIYLVGDVIPESIETENGIAHKVISSPNIQFVGAFSGGTVVKNMKTILPEGHEVLDDGGERRIKELKKEADKKRTENTREYLAESLRDYDI